MKEMSKRDEKSSFEVKFVGFNEIKTFLEKSIKTIECICLF